ncbi:L-glutamate gamma-semialdehyde dehydrogenase [Brevibacillus laterosporus]|uniref:L-glutamate gamma-semialdehyde dehydrogenase n=2 Tax=Brevibacillus TaxID=55080 RepID=A0A0F7EF93_BRELA|nr:MULTISPECIES: L-glutamate gamma-semialdehyde dehydrogenase [Brevibacillus]AKF93279.1 1-pyrroline-5-carboxylate dehydrogenase [Brevibacillus laterosporus]MCR8987530.1 L-glutamate gamma-semialdehyde dehydrogenase [Brevibacillus laterosporus]MCZ0833268.1 L-glutamate gamma-semialdehyde dehydrogenase [Brevibacillus halotolerans]GIO02929.1 1-pyrroline-5-carboxylate dehydrogenase [Brevibacillus halotolerans]
MQVEFKNEPFVNFNLPENKQAFQAALDKVESELGREYDLIIGGERIKTEKKSRSMNPSQKDECIGVVSQADQELAEKAIQVAAKTFETWKRVAPTARSRYLYKAAAILRRRKHEFSAWLVKESGKSWPEADADTAEAIDFMEYYARQMDQLGQRHSLPRIPGEDNELYYIPLGVGIVIPPWNFPLAIMVGMTTAALVTGNTVVLKPASTTPVIAAKFMEILDEAGVPAGVVNFVPGSGSEIGDYLVEHTLTRFISFTGSRDVGLRINELAAKHRPGQKWMKRLVAEMGGKDSIIVDNDADLELAAQAITASAFGFSGQKCSACSRAIIHADVYDEVLARVVERTKALTVGNVSNPEFYTGPVVDEKAYNKILEYIEIGKQEGKLMAGGVKGPEEGYYIMPTVFADVAPDARIMQEEIFGPFVAFCKANDFDHALEIANNTEYGLTGSVISRNRAHLERAREEFHVGNLYFNRKCTGALVGVHPFGGFNMSGTDSKAGGPDYLLLFTQAKLVSELL